MSVEVSGHVVDDATGRPVEGFVVQGGRVDKSDPTKAIWGYHEGRTSFAESGRSVRPRADQLGGRLGRGSWPPAICRSPFWTRRPRPELTKINDLRGAAESAVQRCEGPCWITTANP